MGVTVTRAMLSRQHENQFCLPHGSLIAKITEIIKSKMDHSNEDDCFDLTTRASRIGP